MSYNIEQLKILLDTNIPGKVLVPLTSSMIYSKELDGKTSIDEYPYFTFDVEYPKSDLYYYKYSDIVSFFFNKDKFIEVLRKYTTFGQGDYFGTISQGLNSGNSTTSSNYTNKGKKASQQNAEEVQRDIDSLRVNRDGLLRDLSNNRYTVVTVETDKFRKELNDYIIKLKTDTALNADPFNQEFTDKSSGTKQIKPLTPVFKANLKTIIEKYTKENDNWKGFFNFIIGELERMKPGESTRKQYNKLIAEDITDKYIEKLVTEKEKTLKKTGDTTYKETLNEIEINYKKKYEELMNIKPEETIDQGQGDTTVQVDQTRPSEITINFSDKEKNRIIDSNIMTMLQLLFPTSYPISNNITSSFNKIIIGKEPFEFRWTDLIPGFLKTYIDLGIDQYSYLKIDSKIYTITQVIWLNDIYNHKDYSELVEKYRKLGIWRQKETERLTNEILKKTEKFTKTFRLNNPEYHIGEDDIKWLEGEKARYTGQGQGISVSTVSSADMVRYIEDIIKNVNQLNIAVSRPSPNYGYISDLALGIETAYSKIQDKLGVQAGLKKKFMELTKQISSIRVSEIISEKYINPATSKGLILNYAEEDSKVKDELTSKFREYTGFAETIRDFIRPKKESTNKQLQEAFETFLENTTDVFSSMMNPTLISSASGGEENNYKNHLKTGITISSEGTPRYEIIVRVDLIAGELTDSNKGLVDCMYKGETLGNKLSLLVDFPPNFWEIDKKNRLFFDITTPDVKGKIEEEQKKQEIKEPKSSDNKETEPSYNKETNPSDEMSGGKRRLSDALTRKLKMFMMKTRKNYR